MHLQNRHQPREMSGLQLYGATKTLCCAYMCASASAFSSGWLVVSRLVLLTSSCRTDNYTPCKVHTLCNTLLIQQSFYTNLNMYVYIHVCIHHDAHIHIHIYSPTLTHKYTRAHPSYSIRRQKCESCRLTPPPTNKSVRKARGAGERGWGCNKAATTDPQQRHRAEHMHPGGVRKGERERACKRGLNWLASCGTHVIIKSKTTLNPAVSVFLCSPQPRRSSVRGVENISNATTLRLPKDDNDNKWW